MGALERAMKGLLHRMAIIPSLSQVLLGNLSELPGTLRVEM